MPAIFPTPLPEEIAYSVAARYGDMMGHDNAASLKRALFGTVEVTPTVELPGYVGAMLRGLPPGHSFSVDEILENHTALPYYRALLDADQAARLTLAMREGAIHRIPRHVGLNRQLLPPIEWLRFCETCATERRPFQRAKLRAPSARPEPCADCPRQPRPVRADGVARYALGVRGVAAADS